MSEKHAKPKDTCDHDAPTRIIVLGYGVRARCLECGVAGPVKENAEAARRALRQTQDCE